MERSMLSLWRGEITPHRLMVSARQAERMRRRMDDPAYQAKIQAARLAANRRRWSQLHHLPPEMYPSYQALIRKNFRAAEAVEILRRSVK